MPDPIVFVHAALDETPGGQIVLRGVIAPESLHLLTPAPRSARSPVPFPRPAAGFPCVPGCFTSWRGSRGMRGENITEADGKVILGDEVFIIDGLQRVSAAKLKFDRGEGKVPHLGALVHFNTTKEWERNRFRILNVDRTKLSPNIILRNWRYDYQVMETLHHLTSEKTFIMCGRVCWGQRMSRTELLTATSFAKVVGRLHSHMAPATSASMISHLVTGLQRVHDQIGKTAMRENVKTFFNVIDTAFGVRRVEFKEGAIYMRSTFLNAVARLFSNHTDFWKDDRLFVEAGLIRKLATFPYRDPHVVQLCSSGGAAHEMIYFMLVNHINSGRRTRRLSPRILDYPTKTQIAVDSASGAEDDEYETSEEVG